MQTPVRQFVPTEGILEPRVTKAGVSQVTESSNGCGLERTLQTTQFQPPAVGRDPFHQPRVLQAPSNLALNPAREGAAAASLGSLGLTTLTGKNFSCLAHSRPATGPARSQTNRIPSALTSLGLNNSINVSITTRTGSGRLRPTHTTRPVPLER